MNSQMRNKASLLSRVSTLAILAAAGSFGATQQAQAACTTTLDPGAVASVTVLAPVTCVVINDPVTGNVTNNTLVGDPGTGFTPFSITADVGGQVINNGAISGGFFDGKSQRGALTIFGGATVSGGIVNNQGITSSSGNGLQIGTGGESGATVNGGITNNDNISSGLRYGIAAIEGDLSGGLTNATDATVSGGLAGVFIADTFGSWGGGINNSGQISGSSAAIQMGNGGNNGDIEFSGGIHNNYEASIDSGNGPAILITNDVTSFSGGIANYSNIAGGTDAIVIEADAYDGGLYNDSYASITASNGDAIRANTVWTGDFTNYGNISGTDDGFDFYGGTGSFTGNLVNGGNITGGSTGVSMVLGSFTGNVTNNAYGFIGGTSGAGLVISANSINGTGGSIPAEITNNGHIQGSTAGVVILAETANVNFTNSPADFLGAPQAIIEATSGTGVILAANTWNGNVTNSGRISGTNYGMLIGATNTDGLNEVTDSFEGTVTNSGSIEGTAGTALYITARSFTGDVYNSGVISGAANGLSVQGFGYGGEFGGECGYCGNYGGSFEGTITNASGGVITGVDTGLYVSVGNFTGNITNQGSISGDIGVNFVGATSDIYFEGKSTFNGTFTNTGSITGVTTGLNIEVATIEGDIVNGVGGYISGGSDGVVVRADTITGNITNNGTIIGGGLDTGLHIIGGTMTGDITNNDYLFAPSNALHVELITLNGSIVNTGVIESDTGNTAVQLEIDNGGTFVNTGGGLILGNVFFGGKTTTAYNVVAEDGGIEGSLIGATGVGGVNNDTITVQDGTHYFVDGGGGNGTASNFASFTVNSGGTAVMGSRYVGDGSGTGYSFYNVDAVNVNNGGTLYIDKSTTLNVDNSYTQASGGTLMFYLGAPSGNPAGIVVAGPNDYGQVIVDGTATLNGTIAGYLDPAFGSANPGLTEVQYNDVIVADAIIGDFTTTALVANNSLFELDSLIDGNTVDLRVLRSSLSSLGAASNIVNTGDPFDANIADRTNGMGGCGVAGFGWCTNRYAANEPGATSVMTDATPGEDPFAWLRSGGRRVGETAVWGRGVGVWGETDGDASRPGTDFSLAGAIAGIDHVFAPMLLAGAAVQWTTTDVDFDLATGDAQVDSIEAGAYASYGDARLFVNANVSYIWHDFEVNRVTGPNLANGDYNGNTISAYVEGGKTFQTNGGVRIQPLIAVSYAHLETDAYTETGTGALLNVSDADLNTLKGIVGARFAFPFATGSGRSIVPEARIAWTHEFMDDHSSHLVDPVGGPVFWTPVDGESFSRDTLVLGAGLTASLSETTTVFIDYDAGINSDITSHTISGGFRTRW